MESEGPFDLVDGDPRRHLGHIFVERTTHKCEVGEDECLGGIEADGDDIFCVLLGESFAVFDVQLLGRVHELFVIRKLNDERTIKNILEILGELEWHRVSNVHAVTTRSSSRVEIEWLALLVSIQNFGKISV